MPKAADAVRKGPKKFYSSPQVTAYGTVQELTKKVGTGGNPDSGTRPLHKNTHI
ncbi:MAG: lasso RiPP family leader peptide-containing protein [Candidatus Acidiferrales bacterium]